jgi:hypothetical protein
MAGTVTDVVLELVHLGVDGVMSDGAVVDRHLGVGAAVEVVLHVMARGERVEHRQDQQLQGERDGEWT